VTAAPRHCQRRGCTAAATGALVIMTPYSVEMSKIEGSQRLNFRQPDPMAFFVGAELCQAHIEAFDAIGFLTPGMQMEMARRTVSDDRGRPDFSRAYPESVPLDDPQWLSFRAGILAAQQAEPDPTN